MDSFRLIGGPDDGQVVTAEPDHDQVVRRCEGGIVYVVTNQADKDGLLTARMMFD